MILTSVQKKAMADLKSNKGRLTVQQYRTVKGQILAGDTAGAERGMKKLLDRRSRLGRSESFAKQT